MVRSQNEASDWDDLIFYSMTTWKNVKKFFKANRFSALAIIQGFDKTWETRGDLCRKNKLNIELKLEETT